MKGKIYVRCISFLLCFVLSFSFISFSGINTDEIKAKENHSDMSLKSNRKVKSPKERLEEKRKELLEKSKKEDLNSSKGLLAVSNGFKYRITNKEATVLAYLGKNKNIVIPETLGGCPVKYISISFIFNSNDSILDTTSISLPKSLEFMDYEVLVFIDTLKSIKVHKDNSKFASIDGILYSKDLKSLYFTPLSKKISTFNVPGSVENIYCLCSYYIETVNISKNVKNISLDSLFLPESKRININKNNKYYSSLNGVFYNKNKTRLILYPHNRRAVTFKMPNTVKYVGSQDIIWTSNIYMKNIILSDNLESVYLPEYSIFKTLLTLRSVSISNKSKNFSTKDGVLFNKNKSRLIYYPIEKRAKKYVVPKNVKVIDAGAIENDYLNCITIGRNVKEIKRDNFYVGCLEKVYIYAPYIKIRQFSFIDNTRAFKIYGLYNSTASQYAKRNRLKFKAIKLKYPHLKGYSKKKGTAVVYYKKIKGAKKYYIYRKSLNGKFKLIAKTRNGSFKDTKVYSNRVYSYKVKAIGDKLRSDYSRIVKIKVK